MSLRDDSVQSYGSARARAATGLDDCVRAGVDDCPR